MRDINNIFLKLSKRAETNEIDYLVRTFVNIGPLFTILSNRDHEVLYGRRGTGKTHAFAYLSDSLKSGGEIVINIDLRTIGSNGGIFSDNNIPLKERATRLIIDTFSFITDTIIEEVINDSANRFDLSRVSPMIDRLWDSISEIEISGPIEVNTTEVQKGTNTDKKSLGIFATAQKQGFKSTFEKDKTDEKTESFSKKISGNEYHHINFSSVYKNLQEIGTELKTHIWVMFDEWAEVPQDLQPYLAELIRRTILPNKGITTKIAAIEHRTNLAIFDVNSSRIGIEIGADIAASQNLDEYMVFDNDEEKAKSFFQELLFHHFINIADDEIIKQNGIKNSETLINESFTQSATFVEFVRSCEGVPRDAINILGLAAMRADNGKIAIEHVRSAARAWFSRGKEKAISSHDKAHTLLRWIIDEVIGKRNARAFLLQANQKDPLIEYLFDSRILHIIKENVSGKDTPGLRYNVYSIDYGCYVHLINTANAPKGLFEAIDDEAEEDNSEYVDVPKNDYRAIRRAILNLDEFHNNFA